MFLHRFALCEHVISCLGSICPAAGCCDRHAAVCAAGYERVPASDPPACQPCLAGFYADAETASAAGSSCMKCPNGTTTSSNTSTSAEACTGTDYPRGLVFAIDSGCHAIPQ
jgi:hypothetical protein